MGTLVHESLGMFGALAGGAGIGRESITATRITRQTIRGKEGGVYYVLAPGPSMLLAPTLRVDRALNRARGVQGRLAVSVLAWNALAAGLVVALFLLVREATGWPGLAALVALGSAVVPPFVFYSYQFYPEMPGALVLTLVFHRLLSRPRRSTAGAWLFGALLATLPWLHQKFLPVWLVLVVTAAWLAVREKAPRPVLVGLLAPQAVTLYLTALYNFAITGSVRPDALFLAWGPGGVSAARVGQGLLGLLIDARYGILPHAPLYLLAAAGLVLGGARRFAFVLPAAVVYYATVASADNWSGAVCNLGRYVMPVAPLAVALAGVALARTSSRRGAVAVALMLAGWTGLLALRLLPGPALRERRLACCWRRAPSRTETNTSRTSSSGAGATGPRGWSRESWPGWRWQRCSRSGCGDPPEGRVGSRRRTHWPAWPPSFWRPASCSSAGPRRGWPRTSAPPSLPPRPSPRSSTGPSPSARTKPG